MYPQWQRGSSAVNHDQDNWFNHLDIFVWGVNTFLTMFSGFASGLTSVSGPRKYEQKWAWNLNTDYARKWASINKKHLSSPQQDIWKGLGTRITVVKAALVVRGMFEVKDTQNWELQKCEMKRTQNMLHLWSRDLECDVKMPTQQAACELTEKPSRYCHLKLGASVCCFCVFLLLWSKLCKQQ